MHIKKSHNFAVKKGRVAHILVPFMVGAICGLALADPNLDSNQEKNTYEIVALTTISKMYFFFYKMDRKLAHLLFWSLGQINCKNLLGNLSLLKKWSHEYHRSMSSKMSFHI